MSELDEGMVGPGKARGKAAVEDCLWGLALEVAPELLHLVRDCVAAREVDVF
jgi:hypothetical protein